MSRRTATLATLAAAIIAAPVVIAITTAATLARYGMEEAI